MSRYWDDELYHHGIKGQSWGAQNGPPYPLNAAGKASFRKRLKARMKAAVDDHKQRKAAKKAEKLEEKEAAKAEKRKETLDKLATSPTALYKNRNAYTTEELKKALDRINTEQKLHEMSMKELNRGKDILDTIVGYGQTAVKAYSTGAQLKKDMESLFGRKKDSGESKKKDSGESKKKESSGDSGGDASVRDSVINRALKAGGRKGLDLAKTGGRKGLDLAKAGGRKAVDKGKAYNAARKEDKRRYEGWDRRDVRAYKKRRFAGNRNSVWGT